MQGSTGISGLDELIQNLVPGDNVVFRVDSIEDYIPFAQRFCRGGLAEGRSLVYFRFASHKSIIAKQPGVKIHRTHPEAGFEHFITEIHKEIKELGKGSLCIFDSLSDLSENCYSDRMIGNFFKLTCSYLQELETIAYFSLKRYFHSYHATDNIHATTQLLLDSYRYRGTLYIKTAKMTRSPTHRQYILYKWEDDTLLPVKESPRISQVIGSSPFPGLPSASYRMIGVWDKVFINAEAVLDAVERKQCTKEKRDAVLHQILHLVISRDERMFKLAARYFTIADVIQIWKRMIGTGMIGGKSLGMLLARSILKKQSRRWMDFLEEHDSFFIGSDVFYTFLVENNCWWARQRQKDPDTFLEGNEDVRNRILQGEFPDYIVTRLSDMLDYFGQSPIIVRSSSLLEDNFGNAFAGKYESVFCANQGTKEERLKYFISAVRFIYASSMSDEALTYRKTRGVLDKDEQMALLVQRVSGIPHGPYFFPHLAGVAFSFNPYVWSKEIEPEAGMVRLVFGLGTRAVDRSDDDYTRVVALNRPEKRPEADFDEVKRYAQRRVDTLNLESNKFINVHFADLMEDSGGIPIDLFATRDRMLERQYRRQGMKKVNSLVLTFDKVLKETPFVENMKEMLQTLREAYESHVDVEFTTNWLEDGTYKINLLQCRPFQMQEPPQMVVPLPEVEQEEIIFKAAGAVIGNSRKMPIHRLLYVVPSKYGKLSESKRYAVAKLIGTLTHAERDNGRKIMLIGPGRWGTSTPSLGIPVSFSEINTASVLCEIDSMHEGLIPDLSLGTHFFNEMVEMNMLYIAYFVGRKENRFNEDFFMSMPNSLTSLLPEAREWEDTLKVITQESVEETLQSRMYLYANSLEQTVIVYKKG